MPVNVYVAVRLCSVRELKRLLDAAGWEVSEAARPTPELDALLTRLRATADGVATVDTDGVYLAGEAMSAELGAYRERVIDELNRIASLEAEMARRDEARGALEIAALHEHGEVCLRQAARAIEDMPCE